MTLTDFLLARIAEDEAFVQGARRSYQHVFGIPHYYDPAPGEFQSPMVAMNPRVAAAECEAKRRIVELHAVDCWTDSNGDDMYACQTCRDDWLNSYHDVTCPTLLALALPYADHPDYQEVWRARD